MNEIIKEYSSNYGIENIHKDIKREIIFEINKFQSDKNDKKYKKYFLIIKKRKNFLINISYSGMENRMSLYEEISLLYNLTVYLFLEAFGEVWSNYTIKMNFIDYIFFIF